MGGAAAGTALDASAAAKEGESEGGAGGLSARLEASSPDFTVGGGKHKPAAEVSRRSRVDPVAPLLVVGEGGLDTARSKPGGLSSDADAHAGSSPNTSTALESVSA